MKFDTKVHHKKDRYHEHRFLDIRVSSLAAIFPDFLGKKVAPLEFQHLWHHSYNSIT